MREPKFETRFFSWAKDNDIQVEELLYQRSSSKDYATENAHAYRFIPKIKNSKSIVFMHGAGNDSLFPYIHLFKPFLRKGFEIFTFDLDGHGRKSSTYLDEDTISTSVIDALHTGFLNRKRTEIHILASSIGGAIAINSLAQINDPLVSSIHSAVIIAAPMKLCAVWHAYAEIFTLFHSNLYQYSDSYHFFDLLPSFGPFGRNLYPIRFKTPHSHDQPFLEKKLGFGYLGHLRSLLKRLNLEHSAKNISIPILLLYGSRDRLAPSDHGKRLHEILNHSEFKCLQGQSHFSLLFSKAMQQELERWFQDR